MSIRITRPRFRRALNDARCELAEARARAAASLAKMHREDGTWLGWLAKEHYQICLDKWVEYLHADDEERVVARYEFLINLKIWLQLLPLPVSFERDSYRQGNVYIAGFFGEDAFVVSHSRAGKRYRLLSDGKRTRRNDPYLRYPGSERYILPDGDDVGIIDTAESSRDRLVCLHDAFVLVAVTTGDAFRFRFVGANDKYAMYPKALEKDLQNYVGMNELVERIKREIKGYGDSPDEVELPRVDEALCAPASGTSALYKPEAGSLGTVSLSAINSQMLDEIDPMERAPSLTRHFSKAELNDTIDVSKARKEKPEGDTAKLEKGPVVKERTTAKRVNGDTSGGEKADTSKHGSRRITSRKVITNAISRADMDARRDEAAARAKQQEPPKKKRKRSLTQFFDGILDEVDPLAVRPQLRKAEKGKTKEINESDHLAHEFMELTEGDSGPAPQSNGSTPSETQKSTAKVNDPESKVDTAANRVISNFSRRSSTAREGRRTRRPSGEVTTAIVRDKVRERNNAEYNAALLKLQGELDRFFDDHDTSDITIHTGLHSGRSTTELLRLQRFDD